MGPPLWSSGQSSWIHIQRLGFDSRSYQIFWEVVGLERGPLSLVSTIEELLGRSSGSGLENREYCRRVSSRWLRDTIYPQTAALTSSTGGSRPVGIVHSQTKVTELIIWRHQFWIPKERKTSRNAHSMIRCVCSRIKMLTKSFDGSHKRILAHLSNHTANACSGFENLSARIKTSERSRIIIVLVESKGCWWWCRTQSLGLWTSSIDLKSNTFVRIPGDGQSPQTLWLWV
jgi:hypothetical protein